MTDSIVLGVAVACFVFAQLSLWHAKRLLSDSKRLLDRVKRLHDRVAGLL
jgi:hypothetical protein